MIGVGYRRELAAWIASSPPGLDCLEITAEHFYGSGETHLDALRQKFALFVHGLGLSLGTPGALDSQRLRQFARVSEAARAEWISEHIAFTRTADVDLGHLNPVLPTRENARIIADHARQVAEACGKPIILENITSHVRMEGELSEAAFLNDICDRADCGLLLDVTNLFINSRNHRFDPLRWLAEIDSRRITELHIVGYSMEGGRWTDSHACPIQQDLIELAQAIVAQAPPRAIILERDEKFPGTSGMAEEMAKLEKIIGRS